MNTNTTTLVRRAAVAAAVLVATAAVSGLQAQTMSACYTNKNGTMYRVGTTGVPADCTSSSHTKETWNLQGPAGPQGPQGPQGPKGDPGVVALPFATSQSSTSSLFSLTQTGTGGAAQFLASSGAGVFGRSISGAGVHGVAPVNVAGATGVRAENGTTTGTALEITRGAIRVVGAGVGTPTAAFRVVGQVGAKKESIFIDHPMTNNDPNAIVIATPMNNGGCALFGDLNYHVGYAYLSNHRWFIMYEKTRADVCNAPVAFNVLIIKS